MTTQPNGASRAEISPDFEPSREQISLTWFLIEKHQELGGDPWNPDELKLSTNLEVYREAIKTAIWFAAENQEAEPTAAELEAQMKQGQQQEPLVEAGR